MIDLYGIVSIPFLKKSAFSGSFRQMRYRLEKAASDEGEKLRATCWWRDVSKSFGGREALCTVFF